MSMLTFKYALEKLKEDTGVDILEQAKKNASKEEMMEYKTHLNEKRKEYIKNKNEKLKKKSRNNKTNN